ncbi:MAG TPA: alpha-amylase family glycosyl hydrolase, partial [Clostridia bacterium]
VLDHSGHVFDYVYNGRVTDNFKDEDILNGPSGCEPPVLWIDSKGRPRRDWKNIIPEGTNLSPDDAIYPDELRNYLFYRRRGEKISDDILVEADPDNSFVKGDFSVMRQFAVEFDAALPGNETIRDSLGTRPVLSILSRIYQYIIAKYDIDGFRIDTVKHVHPSMVETFGNSIREFALSIGKKNFFIFGEIYDNEDIISKFVGRNSTEVDSFGIDAALDFCVFYKLPGVAKSTLPVEDLRNTFEYRRQVQIRQLSTHGETGRFFVTFLDNHDICSRFYEPDTSIYQVLLGITLLFTLQGIPCLYYGTEQGFQGAKDERGKPLLIYPESVREAMWGSESKFDTNGIIYKEISKITGIKNYYAPLRYGRFYFRELSANGKDFGQSFGIGGIVAFSRVLWNDEVLVAANTSTTEAFKGFVIIDRDVNIRRPEYNIVYSNMGSKKKSIAEVGDLNIWSNGEAYLTKSARLYIELSPMEVQILAGF